MKFIPLIAEIDVPVSELTHWLPGLIGLLFVVALMLSIWNQGKKAFGRTPPLDDQLKQMVATLRGEIHREKNSALKEYKLKLAPVAARVAKSEEAVLEIQLERQRHWNLMTGQMHALELRFATMTGRIDALLKKMEGAK